MASLQLHHNVLLCTDLVHLYAELLLMQIRESSFILYFLLININEMQYSSVQL